MDKAEFGKLAAAIRTYYPREKILPNAEAVALWYEQLKDIPYNVATASLNKWVSTEKWSPTIADLRRLSFETVTGGVKAWGEAWDDALRLIRRYGHNRAKEAFAEMDELTAKVVRQIGYMNLCMSENQTADRANFRMIYEQEAERKAREGQMPQTLREAIGKIQLAALEKKEA